MALNPALSFGPPPFLYYNPHPDTSSRQHGHFSPHPRGTTPTAIFQHAPSTQPPTLPVDSAGATARSSVAASASVTTRTNAPASPPMALQKPTIVVSGDENRRPSFLASPPVDAEAYCMPSTPPLSVSGSTISSPLSVCAAMSSPAVMFGQEHSEDFKCSSGEPLLSFGLIPGEAWNPTPPLTPGKRVQPVALWTLLHCICELKSMLTRV